MCDTETLHKNRKKKKKNCVTWALTYLEKQSAQNSGYAASYSKRLQQVAPYSHGENPQNTKTSTKLQLSIHST